MSFCLSMCPKLKISITAEQIGLYENIWSCVVLSFFMYFQSYYIDPMENINIIADSRQIKNIIFLNELKYHSKPNKKEIWKWNDSF